jgi:hypothetical protein
VREFRSLGSARGAARKGGPYRDRRGPEVSARNHPLSGQPAALGGKVAALKTLPGLPYSRGLRQPSGCEGS